VRRKVSTHEMAAGRSRLLQNVSVKHRSKLAETIILIHNVNRIQRQRMKPSQKKDKLTCRSLGTRNQGWYLKVPGPTRRNQQVAQLIDSSAMIGRDLFFCSLQLKLRSALRE
jgi:hypothetical protein